MAGTVCTKCGAAYPNAFTMLCYNCDPQYNRITGAVCKNCSGPNPGLITGLCGDCKTKLLVSPQTVLNNPILPNPHPHTKTCVQCGSTMPISVPDIGGIFCANCRNIVALPMPTPYSSFTFSAWGAEPEPLKAIETVQSTTPIVGYRVWNLDRKDCKLVSCVKKYPWPLRRRLCRDEFDNMGIHAVKNTQRLVGNNPFYTSLFGSSEGLWREYDAEVAGSIYMWGEVKECSEGYLAEFAYPKQLWMPEDTDPTIILQLEENYGVPCDLSPHFKKNEIKDDSVWLTPGGWVS